MLSVATDPGLRQKLALAGPQVAARYTWEDCAAQHLAIYDQLTGARGTAPADARRPL